MDAYGFQSEVLRRQKTVTHNPRELKRYRTTLSPTPRSNRVIYGKPLNIKRTLVALLGLLVCGLLLHSWLVSVLEDAALPWTAASEHKAPAMSTPVSQWRQGEMPYLYQTDPAWSDAPYAGATVKTHGCGPTCLSMVQAYFKGSRAKSPDAMCEFSEQKGFVDAGATSWTFMTEGAAQIGLMGRELPASADVIRTQLRMGHPVICCVGPGDFTTEGHFIVLSGEFSDGTICVHDPNSVERSQRTWDLDRIIGQCRNIWAFSA